MRTVFDKHKLAWKHFYPEGNGKAKPGYCLHHKDETLRHKNPDRYEEWRIEDLVMITSSEHGRHHRAGCTPWNKGRHGIYSEETIEKLRKANIGKPSPNKGRKYTEEQRKAKSECMKRWAQMRKETLIANGRTEDEVCGWHLKPMQNEKE